MPRHPSQLYEAALEGIVLFLVLRWATHRTQWLQRPGADTACSWSATASSASALENVRKPDDCMPELPAAA